MSIDTYETVDTWPTFTWLSIDCWPSVNRMSIECPSGVNLIEMMILCLLRYQSSVDRGVLGTDWHLTTGTLSKRDPRGLYLSVTLNKVKFHLQTTSFSKYCLLSTKHTTINVRVNLTVQNFLHASSLSWRPSNMKWFLWIRLTTCFAKLEVPCTCLHSCSKLFTCPIFFYTVLSVLYMFSLQSSIDWKLHWPAHWITDLQRF